MLLPRIVSSPLCVALWAVDPTQHPPAEPPFAVSLLSVLSQSHLSHSFHPPPPPPHVPRLGFTVGSQYVVHDQTHCPGQQHAVPHTSAALRVGIWGGKGLGGAPAPHMGTHPLPPPCVPLELKNPLLGVGGKAAAVHPWHSTVPPSPAKMGALLFGALFPGWVLGDISAPGEQWCIGRGRRWGHQCRMAEMWQLGTW